VIFLRVAFAPGHRQNGRCLPGLKIIDFERRYAYPLRFFS
jgi:hypothetical protein